jgi:raffinose/stachyose/melibiose transport system substrate-binding protein
MRLLASRRTRVIRALAGVAIAAVGLAAAGCGGSGDDDSSSGGGSGGSGSATLKLSISQSGGTGENPIMPIVRAFEKQNPNMKIKVSQYPIDQYPQILRTQLRSGTGPDLFYGSTGTGAPDSILPLAQAGFVADLSGASWISNVPESAKPLIEQDGKTYMLPLEYSGNGVVYNVDNFKKFGVEIPETFGDLINACKTIKSKGGVPIALAGGVPQNPSMVAMLLSNSYVYSKIPDWTQQREAGKTTFAKTPEWKTVVQRFKQLNGAGCFQKGAAAAGFPQLTQLLGSGKASMVGAPIASIKTVTDSGAKVNMSAFAMPGDTADATRLTASPNYAMGASARSKSIDAAKKFLDFFAQPAQADAWAEGRGDVSLEQAAKGSLPPTFSNVESYFTDDKALPFPPLTWHAGVQETLGKQLTGLITGQVNEDQVLQAMDQAWDQNS